MCQAPRQAAGGDTQRLRVVDVLRAAMESPPTCLSGHQWKTLDMVLCCRTPQLGMHRYRCEDCGCGHLAPNSCRNRHCPTCQKRQAREWLEKQRAALLPVPYFHVVFTLPHSLNPLIEGNRAALYNLLFQSASATLLRFGDQRMGARIGVTAVLHTWSQTLLGHYHLHCIVTGGGIASDGSGWKGCNPKYLFPVRALSGVFRAKFRDGLRKLHDKGKLEFHGRLAPLESAERFGALLALALARPWNVYAKRPFGGPDQVLGYLSRYTHRVAIGDGRIADLDRNAREVTFRYKDYADSERGKSMTLGLDEFLRRYCLHILPNRFVKIRHYGLLANRGREERLEQARTLLKAAGDLPLDEDAQPAPQSEGTEEEDEAQSGLRCPRCGSLKMLLVERIPGIPPQHRREPPPGIDSS